MAYHRRLNEDHADKSYRWLHALIEKYIVFNRQEKVKAQMHSAKGIGQVLVTNAALPKGKAKAKAKGGKGGGGKSQGQADLWKKWKDPNARPKEGAGTSSWSDKKQVVCKFFLEGSCKFAKGKDCPSATTKKRLQPPRAARVAKEKAKEKEKAKTPSLNRRKLKVARPKVKVKRAKGKRQARQRFRIKLKKTSKDSVRLTPKGLASNQARNASFPTVISSTL